MLSVLEDGRFPTFSYNDWQKQERVEVALSAVAFQKTYDQFSQCLSNLLPYSFEDISFTVLHYDSDSEQLNKQSMARLAQIAEYIRYSNDVDLVLMATYTDSRGPDKLTRISLNVVRKTGRVFSLSWPAEGPDQVHAYGERRPIADNTTPIGRNKNRRVVISMGRTII